ncbi:MAG: hypothetical protein JWO32_1898 [Bacteroidetes bacterium]|nr:hypothetical protein [Bacteroidota bacterium]
MEDLLTQPFHFFVVDDDKDDQLFFERAIKTVAPQAKVTCFSDGTEVMNCLYDRQIIPNLIFLDLKMQKQGGQETLTLIKQNEFFFEIPVVILTSATNIREKENLMQIGANAYFNKPDSDNEMQKIVQKVCKSFRFATAKSR